MSLPYLMLNLDACVQGSCIALEKGIYLLKWEKEAIVDDGILQNYIFSLSAL